MIALCKHSLGSDEICQYYCLSWFQYVTVYVQHDLASLLKPLSQQQSNTTESPIRQMGEHVGISVGLRTCCKYSFWAISVWKEEGECNQPLECGHARSLPIVLLESIGCYTRRRQNELCCVRF